MRNLLHFGLFVLALTAVTQADAQDRRHVDRHTTVVIAASGGPRVVRPVRASVEPSRAVYDSRRTVYTSSRVMHDARRAYFDERQDLEQIVSIANQWERATANRNRHAQSKADRRLDVWLHREIRESVREPYNHRYTQRVRVLSDQLVKLERRGQHGRGYQNRGHHGYGHGYRGQSHYDHGPHAYHAKKARILNELVELSERQVRRAQVRLQRPYPMSFAYR